MNKTWLNLIILGIIFLMVAISWELYQDSAGYRSKIDYTVLEYPQSKLLYPKLEQHILNDQNFNAAQSSSSSFSS